MPARRLYAALISGAATLALAPAAFAACNINNGACAPGANYTSAPYQSAPINVHYAQPFEHLSSVTYKQTPNVNVLRVQTGQDYASLDQAPGAYWQNCTNASGAPVAYCGQNSAAPSPRMMPHMNSGYPMMQRPVASMPSAAAMGYGVPSRGFNNGHVSRSDYTGGPVVAQPGHAYVSHNTIVHRIPAQYGQSQYSQSSTTASSGGWKQVSGPTVVDGMLATQVICKQPEPTPVASMQAYQVVRPVIQVRYPVAVQVPMNMAANAPYCTAAPGRGGRY